MGATVSKHDCDDPFWYVEPVDLGISDRHRVILTTVSTKVFRRTQHPLERASQFSHHHALLEPFPPIIHVHRPILVSLYTIPLPSYGHNPTSIRP